MAEMNRWSQDKTGRGMIRELQRSVTENSRRMLADRLAAIAVQVDDLDDFWENGVLNAGAITANRPPTSGTTWVVDSMRYSTTAGVQTAYGVGALIGWVYRRFMVGGVPQPWVLVSVPITSVAPTFQGSGFTLGNGTASMRYSVTDGNAYVALDVICGSTTTITGDMTVAMPVPMVAAMSTVQAGNGRMTLRGRNYHLAALAQGATLYVRMLQDAAAITPPVGQQPAPAGIVQMEMSAFSPVANDRITATFVYPIA